VESDDRRMTTRRSVRLSVELEPSGQRISGSVHDELGRSHRFSNWLSLLQLLEAGRSRAERNSTREDLRAFTLVSRFSHGALETSRQREPTDDRAPGQATVRR
jgi:hypothetical protein